MSPKSTPKDIQGNREALFQGLVVRNQKSGPYVSMKRSHWHDGWEFYYLASGTRRFIVGGQTYHLRPGDFMIIRKKEMHQVIWEGDGPHERYFIFVPVPYMEQLLCEGLSFDVPSQVIRIPKRLRMNLLALLDEMVFDYFHDDPYASVMLRQNMVRLLIFILRNEQSAQGMVTSRCKDKLVDEACALIHRCYQEVVTLEQVAQALDISPSYLSRRFSAAMGVPFKQFVSQVRLEAACRMLQETDADIASIAASCGFGTMNYMGEVFRKSLQLSPSGYRKRKRKPLKKD